MLKEHLQEETSRGGVIPYPDEENKQEVFDIWWNLYDKKRSKKKTFKYWCKNIKTEIISDIMKHTKNYVDSVNFVVLASGSAYTVPTAQKWHFGNTTYGSNHFNWTGVNASMVSDSATFTISEDSNSIGVLLPAALTKVVLKIMNE